MDSPIHCSIHQSRFLENTEMLRDRRKRHIERFGELSDHSRTLGQPVDESPPGSIGEGVENPVKLIIGRSMRSHH